jgi:YidC/Oxa1 family membrane protein insertase
MSQIPEFFGGLLYKLYEMMPGQSYGIALILFTIVIKFLLLPLAIKATKSQMRMQELQPKIKEIQNKYKDDKEEMNKEMMKFYQENSFNPASGCLPSLLQIPILYILFRIIQQPLTYMLQGRDFVANLKLFEEYKDLYETDLLNMIDHTSIGNIIAKGTEAAGKVQEIVTSRPELIDKIVDLKSGMNFFGIHLNLKPTISPDLLFGPEMGTYLPLLLVPILATLAMFFSAKMMMNKPTGQGKASDPQAEMAANMQKKMVYIGPVLTLVFSFQFPAGLGIYWIASSVFQIFQQQIINKNVKDKKEVELK